MNRAVEVLSFADVERAFGGLHASSETSFALSQYFLNGGSRAYVVRVAAPGSGASALGTAEKAVPGAAGGTAFTVRAVDEGAWGDDVRLQVVGPVSGGRYDLLVARIGTQGGRPVVLQQERFAGLSTTTSDPSYFPSAVNGTSRLVVLDPGSGLTAPAASPPSRPALATGPSR
jgi:hypothetical protein